jgi:hypothetical protein
LSLLTKSEKVIVDRLQANTITIATAPN